MNRETLIAILLAAAASGAQAQQHAEPEIAPAPLLTHAQVQAIRVDTAARAADPNRVRVVVCAVGGAEHVIAISAVARGYQPTRHGTLRERPLIDRGLQSSIDRHLAEAGCRAAAAPTVVIAP